MYLNVFIPVCYQVFRRCIFLYSEGDIFMYFMKALRNVQVELKPERSAMSVISVCGSVSRRCLLSCTRNWFT